MTIDKLRNVLSSAPYRELLGEVTKGARLPLDANPVPSDFIQFDIDDLATAHVALEDLTNTLQADQSRISRFCILKVRHFSLVDDGQDYPSDHFDLNEKEKNDVVEVLPFLENFLIRYVIEYHLIKKDLRAFDAFLKSTRIPQVKKYKSALLGFFDVAQQT